MEVNLKQTFQNIAKLMTLRFERIELIPRKPTESWREVTRKSANCYEA